MNIYDNNKQLLSTLGVEGNYSTDFEVRKAILTALGGDATECNTIYEVDTQILKIYEEGGGGGTGQKTVFKVKDGASLRTNETEIPFDIDSSEVTDFSNMFNRCSNLTSIPYLDTSKGTSFSNMFYNCNNLTTVQQIDSSECTNFSYMFAYCTNLAEVPLLDTSKGTNFNCMLGYCSKLTSIPQLDTSNGTNFSTMFNGCDNITTIPQLNTSKGTNFSYMFYNCPNLIEVPHLDTSSGTNFSTMFANCPNLITILGIDISKGTSFSSMFMNCSKLENIIFNGYIDRTIDFSPCISLSYDSVKNILTACSNTTNTNSKTLKLNITLTDQNGELQSLIETCNTKKWTINGLTLN